MMTTKTKTKMTEFPLTIRRADLTDWRWIQHVQSEHRFPMDRASLRTLLMFGASTRCFVAETPATPIGYILTWRWPVYRVVDCAVLHSYRRHRVGSQLVLRAVSVNQTAVSIVPESATAMQLLLRQQGFRCVRIVRQAFPSLTSSEWEDGYFFQRQRRRAKSS
jgi:ribosomal protein S18 acetylase RimI-like enzyme